MKPLSKLKGIESGKCVLLGSGNSILDYDFKSLPKDIKTIAVNFCFLDINIDYQVYVDKFFVKYVNDNEDAVQENTKLIGLGNALIPRTDFYFDWSMIKEGFHTGFYALQIAQLLGFEEIYLLGFDYYDIEGKVHYYEGDGKVGITDQEKRFYLRILNGDRWLEDFNKIEWTTKIFNCNPESRLMKFPFRRLPC